MQKIFFPVVVSFLLLTGLQASAQIYISFDGVEGESSFKGLRNAIELSSFSMGASNQSSPNAVRTGSGSVSGKASMSEISFTKQRGAASSALQLALYTGKNIPTAEIRFYKTGMSTPYLVISLENVQISSWNLSTPSDKTGTNLTESFSLNYVKMKAEDQFTNPDGTIRKIPVAWDASRNISF